MSKQEQSVESGGEAYQAGGHLTINKGFGSEQMAEIMFHLSKQIAAYFIQGEATIEKRLGELRESILVEFAKPENTKSQQSFSDPDFQESLRGAHSSYARSGDAELKARLVNLLVTRAKEQTGTRRALLLNQAIAKSAELTTEEHTSLALIFLVKHTSDQATNWQQGLKSFSHYTRFFLDGLPVKPSSIEYLEVVGCAFLDRMINFDFWEVMTDRWLRLFTDGFTIAELHAATNGRVKPPPSLFTHMWPEHDFSLRFRAANDAEIREQLTGQNASSDDIEAILKLNSDRQWPKDRIKNEIVSFFPEIEKIKTFFDTQEARSCLLNPLGKTLAYSVLAGRAPFPSDLSVWVD